MDHGCPKPWLHNVSRSVAWHCGLCRPLTFSIWGAQTSQVLTGGKEEGSRSPPKTILGRGLCLQPLSFLLLQNLPPTDPQLDQGAKGPNQACHPLPNCLRPGLIYPGRVMQEGPKVGAPSRLAASSAFVSAARPRPDPAPWRPSPFLRRQNRPP